MWPAIKSSWAPLIYSKFDVNISNLIDTPAWYQSNSPNQETDILLPFSNPSSSYQFRPVPTSSYSLNDSPLYSDAHLTCASDSFDSTDSIQQHFIPGSMVSRTSKLEVRE